MDQPNVTLSALAAEAGTIETRLFETAGKATRATLRLPLRPPAATAFKLNGEKVRSLDVAGDSVTLDFRPWEIVTGIGVATPLIFVSKTTPLLALR